MNTERASYFTERSYTTSEAENKKDIFEYWKKILGEDTLRVAEKCYGIDLVKVLNSENYVCENNHVMSEMEKVKIELFEKPINYNYSGFKGEKLAFDNFFIPLINYGIDILKNGTSLFLTDSIIDTYANTLLERLGKISLDSEWETNPLVKLGEKLMQEHAMLDFHKIVLDTASRERLLKR